MNGHKINVTTKRTTGENGGNNANDAKRQTNTTRSAHQAGAKKVETELIGEERDTYTSVQRVPVNESNDRRLATPLLWLDKIDFDGANEAKITDRVQPIVRAIIRTLGNKHVVAIIAATG